MANQTFRERSWDDRFKTMGDIAEAAFEERHTRWSRYGWDRPDVDMGRNSVQINYTPDYAWEGRLVEVQGCGQDQWFKFKDDKLVALKRWQTFAEMPVILWLWDASTETAYTISIDELWKRTITPRLYGGETGSFPEGKTFVKFHSETFPLESS